MIETTIPEIDVTDLMERVRIEAAKIKTRSRARSLRPKAPQLPPVQVMSAFPQCALPKPVNPQTERLQALLQQARANVEVAPKVPKLFRRFFRRQAPYNRLLLEAVRLLTKTNQSLANRVQHLCACIHTQNHSIELLAAARQEDSQWMAVASQRISEAPGQMEDLGQLEERTDDMAARLEKTANLQAELRQRIEAAQQHVEGLAQNLGRVEPRCVHLETRLDHVEALNNGLVEDAAAVRSEIARERKNLDSLLHRVDALAVEVKEVQQSGLFSALQSEVERLAQQAKNFEHAAQHLRNLQDQYDRLGLHVNNLQGEMNKSGALFAGVQATVEQHLTMRAQLEDEIARMENRQNKEATFMKGELSEYRAALSRLVGDMSREKSPTFRSPASPRPAGTRKLSPSFDSFYLSFENRFRGPRAEIKRRIAFYLPFLARAKAGAAARPILDLGCGRGEWLELLREKRFAAQGVDSNSAMIAQCQERKLKVVLADAVEYLRSLRAGSQGGVTGFHIIEHLPFEVLMNLFAETRRVLKPGGIAIFESPNCKNLIVGASNFNIDPTHRRPVFPDSAEFMLESQGFERIQLEYLTPVDQTLVAGESEETGPLKDLLYGPQDFAAIAYKPKTR